MQYRSIALVMVMGATALGLVACEPVPATRWGKIAHPTMTASEMTYGLDGHVRAVSEGATGGLSGGGGGCGCN